MTRTVRFSTFAAAFATALAVTAAPALAEDGARQYSASTTTVGGITLLGVTAANGSEGEPQPLNSLPSLPEAGGHWSVRQERGEAPGHGYGQLPGGGYGTIPGKN